MEQEWANLLRRCAIPWSFLRLLWFDVTRTCFVLRYRFARSMSEYPDAVRDACRHLPPSPAGSIGAAVSLTNEHRFHLRLASGFLDGAGNPDWRQQFDDPEQTMSLHRWHWLLTDDRSAAEGLTLMRSWLVAMGAVPDGVGGTPYTTSERVVNALLFLRAHRASVPDDLRAPLLVMAHHVARHMEYHGPRATGNHVVNNARALYFAGQHFDVAAFSHLARAVLADALPWLVTADGFLREESSHYHLLFTRWLMEVLALAEETNDAVMRAFLDPWVRQCAERCWFFLVPRSDGSWQIPLIGDVSPDCTPEWLIPHLIPKLMECQPLGREGVDAHPQSGWFRLDRGSTTIFWHVPQERMVHQAAHGHADLCSFVVFSHGAPILIDPGRPTYDVDDQRYAYSGSALAHSALTIDGVGPMVYDRERRFPPWYQRWDPRVEWREEDGASVFTVSHSGFRRIAGDRIDHARQFRIADGTIEVADALHGRRAYVIESSFHAAPDARLTIACADRAVTLRGAQRWASPAYGVQVPSPSFVVRRSVTLPYTLRCTLRW